MRLNIKSLVLISLSLSVLVYIFLQHVCCRQESHELSFHHGQPNSTNPPVADDHLNVWITFTKAFGGLAYKFENLIDSILVSSGPVAIHFNIVTDPDSKNLAKSIFKKLLKLRFRDRIDIAKVSYYDVSWCADQIQDIFHCMIPHFSSKPGSYYSDALFYLSIGMHRIVPENQDRIVLLDCDLQFRSSIELLFEEFNKFQPENLIGLGYELSSVYRRVLYSYRNRHPNTRLGSERDYFQKKRKNMSQENNNETSLYYDSNMNTEIDTPVGFPGLNSGVILMRLDKLRKSKNYERLISCSYVEYLVNKYSFKGHLGDQDFFTILGYERLELFHILDCGWNRQLCKWWRRYENAAVFDSYFKCDSTVKVYHGNCNTPIPFK